jgi:uncharacterized protein (TIGR02145 family)
MLKNGYLEKTDLLGAQYYQIADGTIKEGTKINLKVIEIGGIKVYNVQASIVHSLSAPLLLGQSILKRFGKFSFDYNSATLTLGVASNTTTSNSNSTESEGYNDIDGNTYNTVRIGSQEWMVQDLNTTHYQNGDPIPEATNSDEWTNYTSKGIGCCTGVGVKFYNWFALNDKRGLAPIGFHVPSHSEFTKLTTFLGADAVKKLKSKTEWDTEEGSPDGNGTNSSGFDAKPYGFIAFFSIGYSQGIDVGGGAHFWTSTPHLEKEAWVFRFWAHKNDFKLNTAKKEEGFLVRCIRDY